MVLRIMQAEEEAEHNKKPNRRRVDVLIMKDEELLLIHLLDSLLTP